MSEIVKQDAETVIMKMEVLKDWLGDSLTQKSFKEAIDIAIQSIQEVEQYRVLGTVEELKEAREKQVAKKVIRQKGECYAKTTDGKEYHEIILVCPNCHRAIKRTEALDVHCKYCGQALKWSEEE